MNKSIAEEILREYVEFKDVNGNETVELLPLTIIDIMIEYEDAMSKFKKHITKCKLSTK